MEQTDTLIEELEQDCGNWKQHVLKASESSHSILMAQHVFFKFEVPKLISIGYEALRVSYLERANQYGGDQKERLMLNINRLIDRFVLKHQFQVPGNDAGASRREV